MPGGRAGDLRDWRRRSSAAAGSASRSAQSAQLIAQGVREANERLAETRLAGRVAICTSSSCISIARSEVWRALQVQAAAAPGEFVVDRDGASGARGAAAPARLGLSRRRLRLHVRADAAERRAARPGSPTRSTPSARAPRCARKPTQSRLLRQLVAGHDRSHAGDTPHIGRTLFKLLVPSKWSRFSAARPRCSSRSTAAPRGFRGSCSTATPPEAADPRPWAIRAKLLRKLRTADFRGDVADASADASVAGHRRAGLRPEALSAAAGRARRGAGGRANASRRGRAGRRTCHRAHEPRRRRAARAPTRGPSSTRCSSATGASSTSPGMASRRRRSDRHRSRRATRRSRTAIRAASCFPTARSSARAKSAACAWFPSWSSSTAATSPRAAQRRC